MLHSNSAAIGFCVLQREALFLSGPTGRGLNKGHMGAQVPVVILVPDPLSSGSEVSISKIWALKVVSVQGMLGTSSRACSRMDSFLACSLSPVDALLSRERRAGALPSKGGFGAGTPVDCVQGDSPGTGSRTHSCISGCCSVFYPECGVCNTDVSGVSASES